MTKILACGDIHTRTDLLKKALECAEWDYFVFLGDLCDDWGANQCDNIMAIAEVAEIKKKYGDRFIWLMGNHDWCYLDRSKRISGHIAIDEFDVEKLLMRHIDDIELMWSYKGYFFTHAGISADFVPFTVGYSLEKMKGLRGDANPINMVGRASGGSDPVSSFIWARPEEIEPIPQELMKAQIVGHTPCNEIRFENRIFYCDTLSRHPDKRPFKNQTVLLLEIDDDGNGVGRAINIDTKKEFQKFVI